MKIKEIKMFPAWDRRSANPKKDYGIHGVEMAWLWGDSEVGVVQFVVYTHWYLPHVQEEHDQCQNDLQFPYMFHKPQPADVGYHSLVPQYKGQEIVREKCPYLENKPCYYDSFRLQAEKVFNILLEKGSEGVWQELERRWEDMFRQILLLEQKEEEGGEK